MEIRLFISSLSRQRLKQRISVSPYDCVTSIAREHIIEVHHPCFLSGARSRILLGEIYEYTRIRIMIFFYQSKSARNVLDILYGENLFMTTSQQAKGSLSATEFHQGNRRRIYDFVLVAQPSGISCGPGRMPDNVLRASILPNLRVLRTVTEDRAYACTSFTFL